MSKLSIQSIFFNVKQLFFSVNRLGIPKFHFLRNLNQISCIVRVTFIINTVFVLVNIIVPILCKSVSNVFPLYVTLFL